MLLNCTKLVERLRSHKNRPDGQYKLWLVAMIAYGHFVQNVMKVGVHDG